MTAELPAEFSIGDRLPNFQRREFGAGTFSLYGDCCGEPVLLIATRGPLGRAGIESLDIPIPILLLTVDPEDAATIEGARIILDDGQVIDFVLAGRSSRYCLLDTNAHLLASWDDWPGADAIEVALGNDGDDPIVKATAPVLYVPRALEPEFCKDLIDIFHRLGNEPSGVFRQSGDEMVYVADPETKIRREHRVEEAPWKGAIEARLARRVLPEIEWAFRFRVTGYEAFKIVSYAADERGYFRAHRDNDAADTAHRRFALTVNLNEEEYTGGELRFPEYGRARYRPPTGAAAVFSCSLAHEALPVESGTRYALVSFFYGAGDQVRPAQYRDQVRQ